MAIISEKLRRLRHLFGYSQEYVAFNIGMTQPAYCKWESGQTRPSIDKLQDLASLYQITISELLDKNSAELLRKLLADEQFANKLLGNTGGEA
ncbi:helix-turn-helix domain-containing protein [Arsenicibacter rosenii]|uniref:Transcriptional regulator n=1 Tax=Arsenicibacter rosenii TaxID=1750698 RepID=A0A1S2VRP3_9BACT|nr:helix-turn-helix transcriptional regulator [Arsenicibacter rosenii]OIN60985.1 transcriptional regulator [Arsenicibacter rosenii]